MCHPKEGETKFRIAAKATPRKIITKAGQTLAAAMAIKGIAGEVSALIHT